ncbi:murein biosynthesis integral membrane protein MurJ [Piscinibacter sakaiensis]|uniref:Probable lipid II flippase MurJ n=1 Tax=Piscinibacter sakaiensis TaxID=1547922 RepID=A0A0K8NU77_PISS1|nr:murein biosynthesis integral membrane protein MurJ [Piscinibacter sakaiensis]GAP33814.1 proposed peptidoglycan lipid II flippase MurJ [Piscinibacter sakaiensis]
MNLLRAASLVSLLTLASRVTGMVRDQVIAGFFGASALTDAFNVAFRIPNLLRRLFAEGAFSQAFVPILAEVRTREGDAATQTLVDAVATALAWVLLATCVVGVLGAPVLVWLMAAGLERGHEAVVMTRWMFPYIGFMSLVALSAGILNTWKHFTVPAATPVLLNLAMIAAAGFGAPALAARGITPIYALAGGVLAGGVLQLAVQWPALRRHALLPHIALAPRAVLAAWRHAGVRRVLRQMGPALLGVSVAQLSLLINTQIASHQGTGAVSWLFYADRLMEFPTGLLGVALGVVLLPQLSAARSRDDADAYSALLDWGLRLSLLLALPCALALLVFPTPLVSVLFQFGAFGPNDVAQTVAALRGYGVGLVGLIGVKILAPGFYARQDIRTPVRIAVAVLVLTQLLNLALVPWLGHAGLALSIGLAALVNAGWLLLGLRRRGVYRPAPGWAGFALRVTLAALAMGLLLGAAAHALDWVALARQKLWQVGALAACLAAAALLYFGLLHLAGLRWRAFLRRG